MSRLGYLSLLTGLLWAMAPLRTAAVACPTGAARARADVVLTNRTDCPIYAYLDGEFLGRCESMSRHTFQTRRSGPVILVGRFRCQTWGPVRLQLEGGKAARWTFSYERR